MQVPSRTKFRKDHLRTIGTSDTFDINTIDYHLNNQNKPRNGTFKKSKSKGPKIKVRDISRGKQQTRHNKSLSSAIMYSRLRENTPKTKIRRMMSITQNQRVMTDYSETYQPHVFKKVVSELKKKMVFPTSEGYKLDAFKVIRKIHQTKTEQFFTGKMDNKKYTLVKVKEGRAREFDMERKIGREILLAMDKKERRLFLKVHHVWKERKQWMVAMDSYLAPNQSEDQFYPFLDLFRQNQRLLRFFIQQVTTAIFFLSNIGRAHGNLTLSCLFFPVEKGFLRSDGLLKVAGYSRSFSLRNKQELTKMPIRYHTPPQVLNLILFETGKPFDRQYLEKVEQLSEGWQIDVWSLGVIVLQLLNGRPLMEIQEECSNLIELQQELLIRYSYLLERVSQQSKVCLSNMLSLSPRKRPHPLKILEMLHQQQLY